MASTALNEHRLIGSGRRVAAMEPEHVSAMAAVISAFAWPVVVALFLLTQRQVITSVLNRLKRFKALGFEGELEELERAVTEGAQKQLREETPLVLGVETASPHERSALLGMSPAALDAAETVNQLARDADPAVIRQQVRELAREYESVRAAMTAGDQRTRRMEFVFAKMRTLALAAHPLLDELKRSSSPGERLVAVAILQVHPDPPSLDWLAQRVCEEKPFIGYHAAVALLHAARGLDTQYREKVQAAINKALACLGPDKVDPTDRGRVLTEAKQVASGVEP
jgi:hypothetical protein